MLYKRLKWLKKNSFTDSGWNHWPEKSIEGGGSMPKVLKNSRWSWEKSDNFWRKYPSWTMSTIYIRHHQLFTKLSSLNTGTRWVCRATRKRMYCRGNQYVQVLISRLNLKLDVDLISSQHVQVLISILDSKSKSLSNLFSLWSEYGLTKIQF